MNETVRKNKLIIEFLGYKLAPCNNGQAWESPHVRAMDDIFQIHGRLFNEQPHNSNYLKFHVSFDWLMPLGLYLAKHHSVDCIAKRFSKEEILNDIVDFIEYHNNMPEPIKRKVNPSDWLEFFKEVL